MSETDFESRFAPLLRQLQPDAADCPSVEELLREGGEQALQDHLAECEICRELLLRAREEAAPVDDLSWKVVKESLDSRPAPWHQKGATGWLPPLPYLRALAAGVLLVVVGLGIWVNWPEPHSRISVTRGPVIQLVQPVGPVGRPDTFQWSSPPLADRFRVTVTGPGTHLVEEGSTNRLRLSEESQSQLLPGRRYRWRVEALDETGDPILASEWAEFEVGSGY